MNRKENKQKIISEKSAWKEFEKLVARIEAILSPVGAVVKSPDKIPDVNTGELREVDASIRTVIGSSNILITIECRNRSRKQDTTWIEQLTAKRGNIGAAKTIAVSANGFSEKAMLLAKRSGIEVRTIKKIKDSVIQGWLFSVHSFQFRYDLVKYDHLWDVPDSEIELFNQELKNIEDSNIPLTLWDVPLITNSRTLKKICLKDIFEILLKRTHQDQVKSIKGENSSEIFNFDIRIPKGWLYFSFKNIRIDLVALKVECKLYDYKEQPIKPSANFKYSDGQQDLINGTEYKYENEVGQKGTISIHQDIEARKFTFSYSPDLN